MVDDPDVIEVAEYACNKGILHFSCVCDAKNTEHVETLKNRTQRTNRQNFN